MPCSEMSRPPTINDFKSFSDLQEAIDEFKRYSDRSTSLYERTVTCFHEIVESVPAADKAEVVQSAFSKHEDVKRELKKSPSVFFIGERNCGKSSILNELLRQSSLPVHENPCTARIVRIKYSEQSYIRLVGLDGREVKRESFTGKHLPQNLIVIKDEERENEETLEATVEVGLNHKLLRSGIELIDSPGKSESEVLDRVLDDFLNKDTVPLFVYVISGDTRLTCSDHKTLDILKDKFPRSRILFVCNKVDTTKAAKKYDHDKEDEDDDGGGGSGSGGYGDAEDAEDADDDDNDDDEEEEDMKDNGEEKENTKNDDDSRKESREANKVINKGQAVFNQLRDKFSLEETWKTCPFYYAMSAREVRLERLEKREEEATRRFRRFQTSLQDHLGTIIRTQTRRVVQKLLVLQESFANIVQVQRASITQKASVVRQILQKATKVQTKMVESFSTSTLESQNSKRVIVEELELLKMEISREAEAYKVENPQILQREFQTMVKAELPSYSNLLLNAPFDVAFATFVGDVKSSILEKTCQYLDNAVQMLMKDYVDDLTIAMTEFNKDLSNPIVSRILEETYDVQFLAAKAETDQRLQLVINALLDSMSEVARMALRTEISEPLSKCLCPEDLSSYTAIDVCTETTRKTICDTLLATIDFNRAVDSVREACNSHLQKLHDQLMAGLSIFASLQDAFAESDMSSQLEMFRLCFTPQIRKLTIEGMALNFLQIFGPVTLGLPIAKARYGRIYECTSRSWCRASPSDQCVVKVLDRRVVGESVWNQTAVDLVNMMNIIEKVHGSHTNLLRLHGWVIPEVDVLHVVMEKADRSLLSALQEGLSLYRRMRIALDVAEGLKAIHDVDYVYEDLKPGNILLSDETAKINLAKPESPYDMTPLGAPFHISPEMYQYHGKGHLSYSSYDIYAFGMLLWVLREGTGAARPEVYKDLESIEAMKNVVVEGFLPERLPVVSDACWELMKRCWEERGTLQMVHVVTKLQLILEECMS